MRTKVVYPVAFTKDHSDYTVIAISSHGDQRYGKYPYSYHLAQVENVLVEAGFGENKYRAAAWLHDVLEDTDMTVPELADLFGFDICMLVQACTGVGETREERNKEIYARLTAYPLAAPIKCADRIANVAYGVATGNTKKLKTYIDEWPDFRDAIRPLMTSEHDKRAPMLFCDLEEYMERAEKRYKIEIEKENGTEQQQQQ